MDLAHSNRPRRLIPPAGEGEPDSDRTEHRAEYEPRPMIADLVQP
jgi:hypothetical protein